MKIKKIMLAVSCLVALILFGAACGPAETESAASRINRNLAVLTEANLTQLITPGMSLSQVKNIFGTPTTADAITETQQLVTYRFPQNGNAVGNYLAGFSLRIEHGNVVSWSPIRGSRTLLTGGSSPNGSFGEHIFSFYLFTDEIEKVVKMAVAGDMLKFPDTMVVPDLQATAKVFAGKSGNQGDNKQTVILVLTANDALSIEELARQSLGSQVLVACRGRLIATLRLNVPITSRQIVFEVEDSVVELLANK